MGSHPAVLALLPLLLATALSGCTWDQGGIVTVEVILTEDQGHTLLSVHQVTVQENWTVMDALHEAAVVETAYGGGFVEAIDGRPASGDARDWFYEVDGVQSGRGAADHRLRGGEVVHWDLRDWQTPGVPPGLWNSFPTDGAIHLVDSQADSDAAPGAATPWDGTWPDRPAIFHTDAAGAPWQDIHGATLDGATLQLGEDRLDAPWALVVRLGPPGTARAVVVHEGLAWPDVEPRMPSTGYGVALTPGDEVVVRP